MRIYAGIDEAGYGPMFGPLLVGRAVMGIAGCEPGGGERGLGDPWESLSAAVCRNLSGRKGRLVVNDSKKVHTPSAGIKHLELSVLSFAGLAGLKPASVDGWLDAVGETCHHRLERLPWYCPSDHQPWGALPCANTADELAIARSMLATTAKQAGVEMLDMGAAVVFEDRFNEMVGATRSKASASFTFVAGHLRAVWDRYGERQPVVVVDRQSGRVHYRELLAMVFPEAGLTVQEESPQRSAYELVSDRRGGGQARRMSVSFEVDGDGRHMPVALASMISKYTRELMMARFKAWFTRHAPHIKPTAGYGSDAKRFWQELQPVVKKLGVEPELLRRRC